MRNQFLVAIIAGASITSARAQEPHSPGPGLIQTPAQSSSGCGDLYSEPLPGDVGPALACDSHYVGNGNRFWASGEYLLWSIKDGDVPPLATVGTLPSGGALGPGTITLFGGDLDYDERQGGRFTLGYWLDCCQTKGIEASYFFLDGPADDFNANSSFLPGSVVLARPFFNVNTGLQDRQLVSFPDIIGGNLRISSDSQLQGGELNMLCNLCCCRYCCQSDCCQSSCCQSDCCCDAGHRIDLIGGFRYLGLDEDLAIREDLIFLPTAPSPPFIADSTITVIDQFETRNDFYGGQIGARGEWWRDRWFVNAVGKVALGNMHQEVRISGTTIFTDPGAAPVIQPGGLLALPTNIGSHDRDKFAVIPEIGINVGRQLTDSIRVYAGYTFMYVSSVVRPGDQIDLGVNPTQLPSPTGPGMLVGAARPAPLFRDTDFWAQGVNFGVEFSR